MGNNNKNNTFLKKVIREKEKKGVGIRGGRRKMNFFFLFSFLYIFYIQIIHGNQSTLYMSDTDGDDTNNGSPCYPLKSLSGVTGLLKDIEYKTQVVNIMPGTYIGQNCKLKKKKKKKKLKKKRNWKLLIFIFTFLFPRFVVNNELNWNNNTLGGFKSIWFRAPKGNVVFDGEGVKIEEKKKY